MSRRRLRTLVLTFLVLTGSLVARAMPAAQPNVLFIFTDDHAYQAISAYDGKLNETPNIDRLARDGMLFQRCYVTNSICGPMRAVIQTGKYSHLNGFLVNGNQVDPHELNNVFGNADYTDVEAKLRQELTRLREQLQVPQQDPAASQRGGRDNPTSRQIRDK